MDLVPNSVSNPNLHSRSKLVSLQAARGVAALMVLAYHASGYVAGTGLWFGSRLQHHFKGGLLGVQLFFVLSGFVIFAAHRKDFGAPTRVSRFFHKRFLRVYPIYWVVLCITLFQHLFSHGATSDPKLNHWVIVSSVLLVHVHTTGHLVDVSWTLFHEILFYAMFSALIMWRKVGAGILALWLAGSALFAVSPIEPMVSGVFHPSHLLFAFGMAAAWLYASRRELPYRALSLVGLSVFIGTMVAGTHAPKGLYDNTPLTLIGGFGAALFLLGITLWEREADIKIPTFMGFLGDASYSIYLIHPLVLIALATVLKKVGAHQHMPQALCFVFAAVAALGVGVGFHLMVEKPTLLWLNKKPKDVEALRPVEGLAA